MSKFLAWARQPSTIIAIAGLVSAVGGTVAHLLVAGATVPVLVAGVAFAAVGALIKDNTALPSAVQQFALDAATDVMKKQVAQDLPRLMGDASAVFNAVLASHLLGGNGAGPSQPVSVTVHPPAPQSPPVQPAVPPAPPAAPAQPA